VPDLAGTIYYGAEFVDALRRRRDELRAPSAAPPPTSDVRSAYVLLTGSHSSGGQRAGPGGKLMLPRTKSSASARV
jgi:hypothetical protein